MTTPEHPLSRDGLAAGKQRQSAKKPVPLGTDLAVTLPTTQGEPLPLTY